MSSKGLYLIAGLGLFTLAGIGVLRWGFDVRLRMAQMEAQHRETGSFGSGDMLAIRTRFVRASPEMPATILDAIATNGPIAVDDGREADLALMTMLTRQGFVREIARHADQRRFRVVPESGMFLALLAGQNRRNPEASGFTREVQKMWRQL